VNKHKPKQAEVVMGYCALLLLGGIMTHKSLLSCTCCFSVT